MLEKLYLWGTFYWALGRALRVLNADLDVARNAVHRDRNLGLFHRTQIVTTGLFLFGTRNFEFHFWRV